MFFSWDGDNRFWLGLGTVDRNGARFGAAIETDATAGAALPDVVRRMGTVLIQLGSEFQALGGTGLDAEAASLAFFGIDGNFTARLDCHASPFVATLSVQFRLEAHAIHRAVILSTR
jgi:hypothetical protein